MVPEWEGKRRKKQVVKSTADTLPSFHTFTAHVNKETTLMIHTCGITHKAVHTKTPSEKLITVLAVPPPTPGTSNTGNPLRE